MTTATALSLGDKRQLRLVLETYKDIVGQRIEVEHRIRNYAEFEALVAVVGEETADRLKMEGTEALRAEMRKYRPNKKKGFSGEPLYVQTLEEASSRLSSDEAHSAVNELMRKQEAILVKIAKQKIGELPIWTEWLEKVRGVGPVFTAGLESWTDITKAEHASSLWKYAGFNVEHNVWRCLVCGHEIGHDKELFKMDGEGGVNCPNCPNRMRPIGESVRRRRGERANYNVRLKTLCFLIGESFVRQPADKSGYRRLYDKFREKYEGKPCSKKHTSPKEKVVDGCTKAHRHRKALRLTIKVFLAHYYWMSRKLAGLTVSDPFAYSELGHEKSSYIEPIFDE